MSEVIEKQFIWSVFAHDGAGHYRTVFSEFVLDENRDPEFNVEIGFHYLGAHDDYTPRIDKVQIDVLVNHLYGMSDLALIDQVILELNATLQEVKQEQIDGDDLYNSTIDGFVEGFTYEPSELINQN